MNYNCEIKKGNNYLSLFDIIDPTIAKRISVAISSAKNSADKVCIDLDDRGSIKDIWGLSKKEAYYILEKSFDPLNKEQEEIYYSWKLHRHYETMI